MFPGLNAWLAGKPDTVIKWLLIALSLFGLAVAMFGQPWARLVLAAYYLFP